MPANTALSDGEEDIWLASPPAGLLIKHKISLMHPLDDPEGAVLKTMEEKGDGFASSQNNFQIYFSHYYRIIALDDEYKKILLFIIKVNREGK